VRGETERDREIAEELRGRRAEDYFIRACIYICGTRIDTLSVEVRRYFAYIV
jgi:hypothetical protein